MWCNCSISGLANAWESKTCPTVMLARTAMVPRRGGAVRWWLFQLVAGLGLGASLAVATHAADARADTLELQVKAAFLYNFAKFVEWPSDARSVSASGSLAFCIFGDEPLFFTLTQSLAGKTINGRALVARQAGGPPGVQRCDIAFIGGAEKKRMDEVLDAFAGAGVLSISDLNQFARRGGMIEITKNADKFAFAVNIDAVNRNGGRISSKLLQLGEVVHQSDEVRRKRGAAG